MSDRFSPERLKRIADAQAVAAAPVASAKADDDDDGIGPWPYAALLAGQGADYYTTAYDLSRGYGREANPIMGQSLARQAALKAGLSISSILAMRNMAKEHPKLAKTIGYAIGSIGALAAMHNATIAAKAR